MNFCPVTLQPIPDEASFSRVGLRAFHPRLKKLAPLDLSHEEQLRQARLRADKMSIQGVQPKIIRVAPTEERNFRDSGPRRKIPDEAQSPTLFRGPGE